jgi:hypothetical protein
LLKGDDSMAYNHSRNYFDFHGKRYGVGTIVKLKPEKYGCGRNIERCGGIAEFIGGLDSGYIKFKGVVPLGAPYCGIGWVANPEDKIEEILEPIYYDNIPLWRIAADNYSKTPPARRPDIAPGTILYVTAMLVGIIFNARILIWIVATIIYAKYLIDIYRD